MLLWGTASTSNRNPTTLRIYSSVHDCGRTLLLAEYNSQMDFSTPTIKEEMSRYNFQYSDRLNDL
jgi:hypothetical protein